MALFDALHFPLFALLTLCTYAGLKNLTSGSRPRTLLFAILIAITMSASSELAQPQFERTASWRDFQFDLIGIAAATVTIFLSWKRPAPTFFRRGLILPTLYVAATGVVLLPAWLALSAERRQRVAFPGLGGFEHQWESLVWQPQGEGGARPVTAVRAHSHPSQGKYSLRVESDAASWAGVRLLFGEKLSWSGKRSLQFDIFNPSDGFEIGVRVDGFDNERYTAAVPIRPGTNSCRVSFNELSNRRASIAGQNQFEAKRIILHLGKPLSTRTFYLDNVRLE